MTPITKAIGYPYTSPSFKVSAEPTGLGFRVLRETLTLPSESYFKILKGTCIVDYLGAVLGFIEGVTRSLDYSSCELMYLRTIKGGHRGDFLSFSVVFMIFPNRKP